MTFFGGMLAYVTPGHEALGIAFAFLTAMFYGYGQYLSIAYIQFGADQVELGIAGGLAGVARYAGGAVAVTTFESILVSVQTKYAINNVIPAAEAAGASPKVAQAVLQALPLGAAALEKVQGLTTKIATAAGAAFLESYVQGVKAVALASIGFGGLAIIACLFLEDIGPKMTPKIEIYLENDVQADKASALAIVNDCQRSLLTPNRTSSTEPLRKPRFGSMLAAALQAEKQHPAITYHR